VFAPAANKSGVDAVVTASVTNMSGGIGVARTSLALRPAKDTFVLVSDALFASGSATLSPAATSRLKATAKKLVAARSVTCVGYTDSVGSTAANQRLGLARAKAVCGILAKRAKAVHLVSYGERRPRASNGTAAGRAKNRRVEVQVTY
jgi:OOP family OmpA-OmpF porin